MSIKQSELRALLVEYSELPEFEGQELTSVEHKGRWDSKPLHIAVHRKRAEEVRILLDAGADPNAHGEYGELPLQIAVRRHLFDVAKMLLRAGARCDIKDDTGMDARDDAEMRGAKEKLQQIECEIAEEMNGVSMRRAKGKQ